MFADHILNEDIEAPKIPQTPELEDPEKTENEQPEAEPVEEENEVAIAFRFIEKIRKIKYAYDSQLIELNKAIIELRKNKEAIFSKKLEGDGTKVIPVWENIAKTLNKGEVGEFEPFQTLKPFGMGILTDDYKFRTYDNVVHNDVTQTLNTKKQILNLIFPQYASKVNGFEEIFELGLDNEERLIENQVIDKYLPLLFSYFNTGVFTSQLRTIEGCCDDQVRTLLAFTANPNGSDTKFTVPSVSESMYKKALLGALLAEDDDLPTVPKADNSEPDDETSSDNEVDDELENSNGGDMNNPQEDETLPQPNSIEENPFKRPLFNKILWQLEVGSLLYKIVMKNATDALAVINLYSPSPIELTIISGEVAPQQPETNEEPDTEEPVDDNNNDGEEPNSEELPEPPQANEGNPEKQAQEDESDSMNTDITEEDESDKEF